MICQEALPKSSTIEVTEPHSPLSVAVNKHKPWIETTYHGIVTENDDKVLLDPPLIALDKDAPLRYAGEGQDSMTPAFSGSQGQSTFRNNH